MMKTKLSKLIALALCAAVLFCASAVTAFAESAADAAYVNPETGYRVVIIDDIKLLTDTEKKDLAGDMKPLTQYGNVAFWATDENTTNEIEQTRLKRRELFDLNSGSVFAINMNPSVRKLTIQSYGDIENVINDSIARSITDNVKSYASDKQYYLCAKTAFSQMFRKLDGGTIPEPLKIAGYIVIAFMLGIIIVLAVAFSAHCNPLVKNAMEYSGMRMKANGKVNRVLGIQYIGTSTVHRPPAPVYVSSGRSCSSCSSGSSCSSCSSCSSGSSCSSCGSGGSSSF